MMRSIFFQITMDGDTKKKTLKSVIFDFFQLHMSKGKEYTFKKFMTFCIHKATIYRWMKKNEEIGLKGRVHVAANQNRL